VGEVGERGGWVTLDVIFAVCLTRKIKFTNKNRIEFVYDFSSFSNVHTHVEWVVEGLEYTHTPKNCGWWKSA
jgi:hypothetical protein